MVVGLVWWAWGGGGTGQWDGVRLGWVGRCGGMVCGGVRCKTSGVPGEPDLAGGHGEVQRCRLRYADLDLQCLGWAVAEHDPRANGSAMGCVSIVLVMSW